MYVCMNSCVVEAENNLLHEFLYGLEPTWDLLS